MTESIEVKVDPSMHDREPADEVERALWAGMDTAWNLIRTTAIRSVAEQVRKNLIEDGGDPPPADEVFARFEGDPEGPHAWIDMAPTGCPDARQAYRTLFQHMLFEAQDDLQEAIFEVRAEED